MKKHLLITLAGAGAILAACHPRPETAIQTGRLVCPEREGGLTRVSEAADGKSCRYSGPGGAIVDLRLVPVEGDPQVTLARLEAELATLAPVQAAAASAGAVDAQANPDTAEAARRAMAEALADSADGDAPPPSEAGSGDWETAQGEAGGEEVKIDLPGLRIDANDNAANIQIGPVKIDASETGATVKLYREVRLRGEALSREKRGVRATYIVAGDRHPDGGFVGYEAGGPKTGPLVVAVVNGSQMGEDDGMIDEVQSLVRDNAGV